MSSPSGLKDAKRAETFSSEKIGSHWGVLRRFGTGSHLCLTGLFWLLCRLQSMGAEAGGPIRRLPQFRQVMRVSWIRVVLVEEMRSDGCHRELLPQGCAKSSSGLHFP